ncbi:MAG: hypothetical protein EA397_14935 [Deltaproteobacteria bacterium]|nr:MAG: hypothetical protein EA397_14935 [Deltaproteobacteria bacterium]
MRTLAPIAIAFLLTACGDEQDLDLEGYGQRWAEGEEEELPEDGVGPASPNSGPARVFLTSTVFTGDLNNPFGDTPAERANALCTMHANLANLNGDWIAWISASSDHVVNRLVDRSPWVLTGSEIVAISSLDHLWLRGLDHPVLVDEYGSPLPAGTTYIWTGSDNYGRSTGANTCHAWSNGQNGWGTAGVMEHDGDRWSWTIAEYRDCDLGARLLCMEQ